MIVSLTSFPAAMTFAVHAVQSILDGSVKPDKVVLYLTASQFPDGKIPPEFQDMMDKNPLFEVRFYDENIRSYTKLVPALKDFPNDIIVTIDDDVLYHKNMLRELLRLHKKYPDTIIGHRVRLLKLNAPYREWKRYALHRYLTMSLRPKFGNVQTGVGGVLYPPNSLKPEMLDPKIFMEMAPTVDDIWFWAAAVANGTKIAPVPFGFCKTRELMKPTDICLRKINIGTETDVNRTVLECILKKYPVIKQRIEGDKNSPNCAISCYSDKKNQYTQLMKNALTAINIEPRPLRFRTRADFVWLHWFEKKAKKKNALRFLERCKNKGVRIIWNVHNKIPHGATDLDRVQSFMKLLAEVSYKIVIHSKTTIPILEKLCGNDASVLEKIVYVPHPHYIGVYGHQEQDRSIDNDKLKLCFFGAVKKYKNVELLISAVTKLGFEDIELSIYGRCRPRKYVQSLRSLAGDNHNIKMRLKFIHDRHIPKILASCHLLVLPYNLDSSLNSGATILAFSYGRTVLSPTTGTLSDIEDKSLFFAYTYHHQEQHKEELKKQIVAIREKYKGNYNELLKLGEKCREYVTENNSPEQVAKQLEQVFDVRKDFYA